MENAVSQIGENSGPPEISTQTPQNPPGVVEEKAREIGRRVDSASAHLQDTWGEAATNVKDRLGTSGEKLKYKAQVVREQAKQKMVVAKQRTSAKLHESRAQLETQVQSHPLKTVAYAFGAGALLGVLLGRAKR